MSLIAQPQARSDKRIVEAGESSSEEPTTTESHLYPESDWFRESSLPPLPVRISKDFPSTLPTIEIQFDGGCVPNPGQKYGSWQVKLDGIEVVNRNRVDLGRGTNNEAEFEALEMGLVEALSHLGERKLIPAAFQMLVTTDSTIVRYRLAVKNKKPDLARVHPNNLRRGEAATRMFKHASRCLELLRRFRSFDVRWEGRESNVELFGH